MSTPKLSDTARHVVIPTGIVTTGWPPVRELLADMGIHFAPWQEGIASAALGKRANGKYAATVGGVVLSIPRQVGKTYLVGWLVFALCMLFPGMTVLWTAHRGRTATRTFQAMQGMARRPKVASQIQHVRQANGEQEIRFKNDSVIMFGARESGFGRGFENVDIEVFDEAQILTSKALDDMVPATNQASNPHGALLFFMGTPPKTTDPGESFIAKRARALSGKAQDMVYVEFSADADADPDDMAQVAKANPSYPHWTPPESVQRMRENLIDDESYLREAFGIWSAVDSAYRVIGYNEWTEASDPDGWPEGRLALGLEVAPDLLGASVALAGQREDGAWHVELDEHRSSASWLPGYVQGLMEANPSVRSVVVDVGGPIAALLTAKGKNLYLKGTRVKVMPLKVTQLGAGCANLLDGINAGTVFHMGQPQLSAAVAVVGKRPLGDTGMWVWSRKSSAADITPIQAATYALIGAQTARVIGAGSSGTVSSGERRAVLL
jgi:hypothetical protein